VVGCSAISNCRGNKLLRCMHMNTGRDCSPILQGPSGLMAGHESTVHNSSSLSRDELQ